MTDTLEKRIRVALAAHHPREFGEGVNGVKRLMGTPAELAATVMAVLNDPVLPNEDGTLRAEPQNRLERIVNAMTNCLDAHPEKHDTDKCVVFLSSDTMVGMVAHGYGGENGQETRMVTAAIVDVLIHVRAMFRSVGKDLELIPVPEVPPDIGGLLGDT